MMWRSSSSSSPEPFSPSLRFFTELCSPPSLANPQPQRDAEQVDSASAVLRLAANAVLHQGTDRTNRCQYRCHRADEAAAKQGHELLAGTHQGSRKISWYLDILLTHALVGIRSTTTRRCHQADRPPARAQELLTRTSAQLSLSLQPRGIITHRPFAGLSRH